MIAVLLHVCTKTQTASNDKVNAVIYKFETPYWAYFRSNKPNTHIIGNQIVQREGEKHRKVEWVVILSTFIPTRERKMEDINVLTIPK